MIQLKYGCSCSQINVLPKNWKQSKTSVKRDWIIHYRFYDPAFMTQYPKGKQVFVRGMNGFKLHSERVAATEALLKQITSDLLELDYNPISGHLNEILPSVGDSVINPYLEIIDALILAQDKKVCEKSTKTDLSSAIKYFSQAAKQLHLDHILVKDIRRAHIKQILEQIGRIKKEKWTPSAYNYYRKHLSILFKELVEWDAIDYNPVKEISPRKTIVKLKQILSDYQRQRIDDFLRINNYRFWLFVNIFFHSGSRRTEIMRVKGNDVDLKNQKYKVLIKKGKISREVERTIKDVALFYWMQVMKGCEGDQYIFSDGLEPGNNPIRPEQITRRWHLWVKTKLNIDIDFYSLKHLNTTETSAMVGTALAAEQNKHTEGVLKKHYDVGKEGRDHLILKSVCNSFVKPKAIDKELPDR